MTTQQPGLSQGQLREMVREQVQEAAQRAQEAAVRARELRAQAQRSGTREAEQAAREAEVEAQQAAREIAQLAAQAAREAMDMSRAQGRPGMLEPPPFPMGRGPRNDGPPEGVVIMTVAFLAAITVTSIGVALARAFGRRGAPATALQPAVTQRLERIEHAMDAIAVEVERISEGQRYTTKLMAELRALPQPDPLARQAVDAVERAARPVEREPAR